MTFIEALPLFLSGATIRRKQWRNDTKAALGQVESGGEIFASVAISWSVDGRHFKRHENGFDLYDMLKNDWERVDGSLSGD